MKKIGFLTFAAICIFASCAQKTKTYTLSGTLPDKELEGKTVYLYENMRKRDALPTDSAVVTNGVFKFEGIAQDTPVVRYLRYSDRDMPSLIVLESGNLQWTMDTVAKIGYVKGSPQNDTYASYLTARAEIAKKLNDLYKKYETEIKSNNLTPEIEAELEATSDSISKQIDNLTYDFIKANAKIAPATEVLLSATHSFEPQKLAELFPLFDAKVRDTERFKDKEALVNAQLATEVGKPFVDIKGLDLSGKEESLSNYAGKGKVVFLDFWASWCGPCRRVNPELVATYNKYKTKDIVFVGVSLDENKEAWEKATTEDKITWPQFSNLKGWKEPASKAYGINFIPQNVLIGKDGVIAARNLHGEELAKKIDELLK